MEEVVKPISTKKLLNIRDLKMKPIKLKFNLITLDMTLSFIYKDSVLRTRKTLTNINKLFNSLDLSEYKDNQEALNRIWIIKKTLEGKLTQGFESDEYLKQYCLDDSKDIKLIAPFEENQCGEFVNLTYDKKWCELYTNSKLYFDKEINDICKGVE